jgi:hypothetical protein
LRGGREPTAEKTAKTTSCFTNAVGGHADVTSAQKEGEALLCLSLPGQTQARKQRKTGGRPDRLILTGTCQSGSNFSHYFLVLPMIASHNSRDSPDESSGDRLQAASVLLYSRFRCCRRFDNAPMLSIPDSVCPVRRLLLSTARKSRSQRFCGKRKNTMHRCLRSMHARG